MTQPSPHRLQGDDIEPADEGTSTRSTRAASDGSKLQCEPMGVDVMATHPHHRQLGRAGGQQLPSVGRGRSSAAKSRRADLVGQLDTVCTDSLRALADLEALFEVPRGADGLETFLAGVLPSSRWIWPLMPAFHNARDRETVLLMLLLCPKKDQHVKRTDD